MKDETGITLITLVVSVLVIAILVVITWDYGGALIKRADLQTINTNMLMIQAKTKAIGENARFNNDDSKYVGAKIQDIADNEIIKDLIDKGVINTTENWRLLQQAQLDSIGLGKLNQERGYIVNYDTDEIVYVKGFEHEGVTYYKLSEMKTLSIK